MLPFTNSRWYDISYWPIFWGKTSEILVVCFLLGNSTAYEFRCEGITQKKAYNIQHMAKVSNQESEIFLIIKPTRCTNISKLFSNRTLHVSDSSSVHHQESSTVHTAIGICHRGHADCLLAVSITCMIESFGNVMAHAQKPDFVFRRNGRVH